MIQEFEVLAKTVLISHLQKKKIRINGVYSEFIKYDNLVVSIDENKSTIESKELRYMNDELIQLSFVGFLRIKREIVGCEPDTTEQEYRVEFSVVFEKKSNIELFNIPSFYPIPVC